MGKKRKEDDVTREIMDDTPAKRAAKEVMKEIGQ